MRRRIKNITFLLIVLAASARGETVIFKDGRFMDGQVVRRSDSTIRLKTRFGVRSYSMKDVEQIIESVDGGDPSQKGTFADLPAPIRTVLNAQTDYKLGDYDAANSRLQELSDYTENKAVRIQMDWLMIEIHERQGQWDTAKRLLKEKSDGGLPFEKVRAKAHLDIFEANPDHDLRVVGNEPAKSFLRSTELQNLAREANALKDRRIMEAALREYCKQILLGPDGVAAFSDNLDVTATFEAVKKAKGGTDLIKVMPYKDALDKAQEALIKAHAILGEYADAFELDLVRQEVTHLLNVVGRLLQELIQADPTATPPPTDPRTGRLTPDGARQWRQRCDEFIARAKPLERLADYMLARVERFPEELRYLHEGIALDSERLEQLQKAVKRAKDRT